MYNYPTTLMNFRCPDYLKQDLDQICKFRNMSRTSMLLAHIEKLVEEWKPRVQNATQSPPKPKKKAAKDMIDEPITLGPLRSPLDAVSVTVIKPREVTVGQVSPKYQPPLKRKVVNQDGSIDYFEINYPPKDLNW